MSGSGLSLEEQVGRVRAAVLARHGLDATRVVPAAAAPSAVEDAARLATVNAHWGIASNLPVVGGLLVLIRRVMRITLRWYVNPIVEQQNAFNDAAVRALFELRAENEHLRTELDRLPTGERSAR